MADIVSLGSRARAAKIISFDRAELMRLMGLYAQRVAAGEWRDYAIEQSPNRAAFAVYRHSFDRPLYVVAKLPPGSSRRGNYTVSFGPIGLKRGRTLEDVLRAIEPDLMAV